MHFTPEPGASGPVHLSVRRVDQGPGGPVGEPPHRRARRDGSPTAGCARIVRLATRAAFTALRHGKTRPDAITLWSRKGPRHGQPLRCPPPAPVDPWPQLAGVASTVRMSAVSSAESTTPGSGG